MFSLPGYFVLKCENVFLFSRSFFNFSPCFPVVGWHFPSALSLGGYSVYHQTYDRILRVWCILGRQLRLLISALVINHSYPSISFVFMIWQLMWVSFAWTFCPFCKSQIKMTGKNVLICYGMLSFVSTGWIEEGGRKSSWDYSLAWITVPKR
jgi:hypothetical protein